jgi:hypothetical protein
MMLGPKKEEATSDLIAICSGDVINLYPSPNIIFVMKSSL